MNWDVVFYTTEADDCPVDEFLSSLSEKEQEKCAQYIRILLEMGPRLPSQYAKHIDEDLWELRPEFGGVEMRLFYFTFVAGLYVILHGFKKKTKKTPKKELDTAMKRLKEIKG